MPGTGIFVPAANGMGLDKELLAVERGCGIPEGELAAFQGLRAHQPQDAAAGGGGGRPPYPLGWEWRECAGFSLWIQFLVPVGGIRELEPKIKQ